MDLFGGLIEKNKQIPLAELLRPQNLSDFLGQNNVIAQNSPMHRLLMSQRLFSVILWGPPGCGKTTLARLIAKQSESNFIEISAVTSGIKDIKEAVEIAKEQLKYGKKTILFIDEIHRYSKTQQDALLPHIENGTIFLIGSTTENPSFQVIAALISRTQVIRLDSIDDNSIKNIINKGFEYLSESGEVEFDDKIVEFIVNHSQGDARVALNTVENAYFGAAIKKNKRIISLEDLSQLTQHSSIKYSQQEHYDCASAFQKSLRGSDADAAIYYLAKMITSGEDLRFIARRLIVCASEDVGLADVNALNLALNAHKACEILGLPEARIALAQAVIYVANASKSNKAYMAIDNAISDIGHGKNYPPPLHLRDAHYKDAKKYGFGVDYVYSHANPDFKQQFMPDELVNKKYVF